MLSNRIFIDMESSFSYIESCAGVVKLVDARDSKSRGASTPCRFDSDLRHQYSNGFNVFEERFSEGSGKDLTIF